MATITRRFSLPFLRDIEVCPYSESCCYSNVCVYKDKAKRTANPACWFQDAAICAQRMFGVALLMGGMALSLTLFLLPLGIPMGLLGMALLMSPSAAETGRSA